MINLSINNFKLELNYDMSVLEACSFIGLQLSRFCFHESLAISGNCRMCLIELFDQQKPIASCVQPAAPDLDVYTDTTLVKKAKENVLELLLLNHPLDCPVCERGGECELQDHTLLYGSSSSRFFFKKRSVENKNFGFFIETVMNRCIHCTRCIRYFEEISNYQIFGTLFRGTSSQIGHFKDYFIFKSELFGNVIDLCPVGALNSKHYATSTKRPWEIKIVSSIDLTDSIGSNIYMHIKNNIITRILPKLNQFLNGSLISDKTRFCFDGNHLNRLFKPSIINEKKDYSAYDTMNYLASRLSKKNSITTFFVDNNLDLNSLNIIKKLNFIFGNCIYIQSLHKKNNTNFNLNFLFNKIIDVENSNSKTCFIFGTNIRFESVLLNLKIRKKVLNNEFNIFSLGLNFKNTYSFNIINIEKKVLINFFEGKISVLSKLLILFKSPIIFISDNLICRGWNINTLLLTIKKIIPTGIVINIQEGSNSNGLSFLNIHNISKSNILKSSTFCGLNLKENLKTCSYFSVQSMNLNLTKFLIQTHVSDSIFKANIVTPTFSDFEAEKIFLNLEDRPQKTSIGISYRNASLHTIQNLISHLLFYSSIFILSSNVYSNILNILKKEESNSQRFIKELILYSLKFQDIKTTFSFIALNNFFLNNNKFLLSVDNLKSNDKNYYCNTIICKNSLILNECSIKYKLEKSNFDKN